MTALDRARAVIVGEMLARHNRDYSVGTERDYYATPPIWMVRLADAILAALVEKMGLREERTVACDCGGKSPDGMFHLHVPVSHRTRIERRLTTDWQEDQG